MTHVSKYLNTTAGLALAMLVAAPASALSIKLTELGVGTLQVDDNDGNDLDAASGELLFDGTLGGAFDPIIISATSKPIIGTGSLAELVFDAEADSNFDLGTLVIEVTDTDYTLDDGNPWDGIHALGGFAAGDISIEAFWDPANVAFATTNSIGGPFSFSSSVNPFEAFAKTLFDIEGGVSPFSMTTVLTISHLQGDEITEVSSAAALSPVPVPASLPLLIGGLGLFGFLRRRTTG